LPFAGFQISSLAPLLQWMRTHLNADVGLESMGAARQ
jgi:hypothetical protein